MYDSGREPNGPLLEKPVNREMQRKTAPAAALILATLSWNACQDTPAPSHSEITAVVDSAGVRILTNLPGSIEAAESWSLTAAPVVNIGSGASPDVPLHRVTTVVPLDRARVAVGMNSPTQVQIFEGDGTLVATLGREGEGPGEFSEVQSVVPLEPDSFAVWDPSRRRMSVFTEEGQFVREVDLSTIALISAMAAPNTSRPSGWSYLLLSTPGSVILFGVGFIGPGLGVRRVEVPSYRISTVGEELASFGPFPGEETFMSDDGFFAPYPFAANTYCAASGEDLVVGTAEAAEVSYYGPNGTLKRIVRWPDHDRTVGGPLLSEWSDWLEAQLAAMPEEERAPRLFVLDQMPQAEYFPAFGGLVADHTGGIWVGAYPGQIGLLGLSPEVPRVPARRWLVFDGDGVLVANVHTPEGFKPHAVRDGHVWGIFEDELGVESVRAYEVVRG